MRLLVRCSDQYWSAEEIMKPTTEKKIKANRENAVHATGPTSSAGKRRSARNALKHGILARELLVSDHERPEFESLSKALRGQFAPATAMQEMAFGLVVCCCWRCKLTIRLEMNRLKMHFDIAEGSPDGQPSENRPLERWYGGGKAEQQEARRFLIKLREEVEANAFRHLEDWKDPIIKTCGHQEFYDSLMKWKPEANIDDILLFRALSEKGRMYQMQLPPDFQPDSEKARVIAESHLKWQMALALIDERMQHLEDLARINVVPGDSSGEGHGGNSLDGITRYVTATTRELERAVRWFQELRDLGL